MADEASSSSSTAKGKGKGQDHESQPSLNQNSFLEKLGASASGLLTSSFGNASPQGLASSLSSVQDFEDKGSSSSISNSATAQATQILSEHGAAVSGASTNHQNGNQQGQESFRSTAISNAAENQQNFDQFLHSPPLDQSAFDQLDVCPESSARSDADPKASHTSVAVQADKDHLFLASDGAEVVALLSRPPAMSEVDFSEAEVGDFDSPPDLHGRELPAAKDVLAINPQIKPFDLVPDFGVDHPAMVSSEVDSLSKYDVDPWLQVLDRYHDDVWGDFLPLVKEAKQELQAAQKSGEARLRDPGSHPAIRRLRMLFKHVQPAG